jgi:hypothetical protein
MSWLDSAALGLVLFCPIWFMAAWSSEEVVEDEPSEGAVELL